MPPHRTTKPVLAATIAVLVLAACSRSELPAEPIRSVRTVVVAPSSSAPRLVYAAEVKARSEVRLSFRVAGKLVERRAEVGQRVRSGDRLARLDPEDLRLGQETARAAVQAAEVNHELAVADFRRFKELREQGFISGAELDRREAAVKAAAAQLEQARTQAALQRNQTGHAELLATAPGVVVGVDAEPGAVLAAGAPVVRLAVDGPRDAVFSVPESAVDGIRRLLGRAGSAEVKLWSGGAPIQATVREVAAAADPVTRTFLVKAELAAGAVSLGQSATVTIAASRSGDRLTLPMTAVREHRGQPAVWVVDPVAMVVRTRPVRIAGAAGNDFVIESGVVAGDRVVTAGVHVLGEGQTVRLLTPERAASAASGAR